VSTLSVGFIPNLTFAAIATISDDLVLVINDLIDFNKIESNDIKVDQNVFVLQHLVEDLETLFRNSMAKEGVEFKVDDTEVIYSAFGDGTQLLLKGDDAKIRRVVINLLSNVCWAGYEVLNIF
jgi:signal transduction histidine kinase